MAKEKNDQIEMPFPEIKGEGFVSHEPVEYSAGAPKSPMDILSEELSKGALDTSGDLDQNDQSEEGANSEVPGNVVKFGIRTTEGAPMEAMASAAAAEVLDGLEEADRLPDDQSPQDGPATKSLSSGGPIDVVATLMKKLGLNEENREAFEKELKKILSGSEVNGLAAVSETVVVDEVALEKEVETKITTDPIPTKPKKAPFNPSATQPALTNSEREGGVALNRTTGPSMTSRLSDEGEITKVSSSSGLELSVGKYEVSGFTVSYDEKRGIAKSVPIRDHFHDLETAFASVNVDKYLMPIEGGYKLSTITTGMPTISLNERLLYVYKNGKWSHV